MHVSLMTDSSDNPKTRETKVHVLNTVKPSTTNQIGKATPPRYDDDIQTVYQY